MKKHFLLILFLLSTHSLFAQDSITVKGQVIDAANNETLPGVTVQVKGAPGGTQTDVDGNYSITAPAAGTLVFTYIGFATQEIPVNKQTTINVKLASSAQQLEQVVVVGYGTQKRRDLTGAIARVEGEELTKQPLQTATQALQGKVAGVQIIGSGQPNSQPTVRIRGTGSVLAGASPLYVVDGVLTDDIRNINSSDIVSMDVLKDASAAIYGVRAANGVIIITTRKGVSGPPKVRYENSIGFREPAKLVEMADRNQYLEYMQVVDPAKATAIVDPANQVVFPGSTDWYDELLRKGAFTNHNISVSGGSDNTTYFFSGGYLYEDGTVITNNFSRFTFRANADVNITKKLKLGTQFSLTRGNGRNVTDNGVVGTPQAVNLSTQGLSPLVEAYRAAPVIEGKSADGRYGNTSAWDNVGNPLLTLQSLDNRNIENRFQGNISLDYNPAEWLTLRSAFNTDLSSADRTAYNYQYNADATTFTSAGGNQRRVNSLLFVNQPQATRYIWDNTATFKKSFGDNNFTLLAGSVTENFQSEFITGTRIDVPANSDQWYLNLGNPDQQQALGQGGDKFFRQSFVGRLNYDYAGRYLLSASYRADGSSKFQDKWGYFPTVGAGWVLSEEAFMKNQDLFNFLKFRGSWGKLGNDNIDPNLYVTIATINIPYFNDNRLVYGSVIQDIKDGRLKWETTTQYDVGMEFTLLNNKLSGEVDYYSKKVEDALINITIPAILGDQNSLYVTNAASFENKGIEFSLNWKDEVKEKFSYNVGFNLTNNRNKIIGLSGGQALIGGSLGATRTDNGQPIASYYLYNAIGVYQNQAEIDASAVFGNRTNVRPGDLKYEDINSDGVINEADRTFRGAYQPKWFGGFNLGTSYNNFDLSADFYGNWGNKIFNGKKAERANPSNNIEADYAYARWRPDRPSQTDPARILNGTPPSTYFLESGDFLRLNNLTLGYTLPENVTKRISMSRLRIFATSQNLFTAQKFSGFTPELPGTNALDAGIETNTYPVVRTFTFGLNVDF